MRPYLITSLFFTLILSVFYSMYMLAGIVITEKYGLFLHYLILTIIPALIFFRATFYLRKMIQANISFKKYFLTLLTISTISLLIAFVLCFPPEDYPVYNGLLTYLLNTLLVCFSLNALTGALMASRIAARSYFKKTPHNILDEE